jgi:hypothetical protein
MPDITDIMDVNLEDLSPEQRQQLQDAIDQFQQKCLLSFKKNRSGVPYLKNEMPRVLLPGESDATTQQEKEECMQAFRESADYMLSKHHEAFLDALQQMMVVVFGPGMEQAFSKAPIQGGTVELGESSSQPPLRGQSHQPPIAMCRPIWLLSRKYGTVWHHPASSKFWYLTALSFVNFQEKWTGTSRDSLRV